MSLWGPGLVIAVVLLLAAWWSRARGRAAPPAPGPSAPPAPVDDERLATMLVLARDLQQLPMPPTPARLFGYAPFRALVDEVGDPSYTNEALLDLASGDVAPVAWAALVALAKRPADPEAAARLLHRLNAYHQWTREFSLRVLEAWSPDDPALVGQVLSRLGDTWNATELQVVLEDFLRRRAAVAPLTVDGMRPPPGFDEDDLEAILRRTLDPALVQPLLASLDAWTASSPGATATPPVAVPADADPVGSTYRPDQYPADGLHPLATEDAAIDALVESFTGPQPRSALLVGESGTGKSAVMRRLARRLTLAGWTIVEVGPLELNAGAKFVGMLEERVQRLVAALSKPKTLWLAADFHMLTGLGRYNLNPTGALEMLMPAIRSGAIRVLGEVRPAAFDRMCEQQPDASRAFDLVRLEAPTDPQLAALLDAWARTTADTRGLDVPASLRLETIALSRQYLSSMRAPGGVLRLLEDAVTTAARSAGGAPAALTLDHVLEALARLTGMPLDVLDERRALDLAALQQRFERRVIGQPEAVRCLIERLAMIKAGVTDPSRPYGVFLCAGGSGTGKTELAKTCAELLFGSADRLVRLDMSELQNPQSVERLTGRSTLSQSGGSLAERVRRQPFSVVLLDEFEKAHPRVWDTFLQVFDDARLADEAGEVADFRHTILLLTSNLGTGETAGEAPLGLVGSAERFSPTTVQRAIERAFRPELLNRLDRVLVFRPLTRDVMRRILHKELAQAFERRGLRGRQWAVELDESAEQLLLDTGFSPQFGARPLRRALEQLLLAPLARTIVDRRAPAGEQFLYVRADGDGLAVEFVDPEAAPRAPRDAAALDGGLAAMVYDARGSHAEVARLRDTLRALEELTGAADWRQHKQALLAEMGAPGFWERADRHDRLGRLEYMDRIENALRSAASLLERLGGGGRAPRDGYPRDLVRRVAQSLFLLDAATHEALVTGPRDAFVAIEPLPESGDPEAAAAFAARLAGMYVAWARARGMRCATFDGRERTLIAVSGFAAYALLAPEDGVHVYDPDARDGHSARRPSVRVRVLPQPAEPADGDDALRRAALATLAAAAPPAGRVVRRYREGGSPLVRDAVRGWRTGRVERVFAGNFDVIPADGEPAPLA